LYQQRVSTNLAEQQRSETAVKTYFDDMGKLLLDNNRPLRVAELTDEVSAVAQAKTGSISGKPTPKHNVSVVQLLYEAKPLENDKPTNNLRIADLSDAILPYANLDGVDLSGADLERADLSYAQLRNADLNNVHLSNSILPYANLNGADLSGADLERANLRYAQLRNADLSGADLSEAYSITDEQLAEAKTLSGATMPDGSTHD
jgi:uncharacterized protein YjbI with pentapeptide repeats